MVCLNYVYKLKTINMSLNPVQYNTARVSSKIKFSSTYISILRLFSEYFKGSIQECSI